MPFTKGVAGEMTALEVERAFDLPGRMKQRSSSDALPRVGA
jgi:hypothetical protein